MFKKVLSNLLLFLLIPTLCFGGVDLKGDADYVQVGTMGNFGTGLDTNYFYISVWIKTSTTDARMTLCGTVNNGAGTVIQVFINTNEEDLLNAHDIYIFRRDEDSQIRSGAAVLAGGVADGSWHNIIVGMSTSSPVIYLDGVSQSITDNQTGTPDNMANFEFEMGIGARSVRGTYDRFFNGEISEVFMWSTSTQLTQSEIDLLSSSRNKRIGLQIRPSDLGGYWALDEFGDGTAFSTTASAYKDLSGNGNHGTGVDADGDSTNVAETVLSYPE